MKKYDGDLSHRSTLDRSAVEMKYNKRLAEENAALVRGSNHDYLVHFHGLMPQRSRRWIERYRNCDRSITIRGRRLNRVSPHNPSFVDKASVCRFIAFVWQAPGNTSG